MKTRTGTRSDKRKRWMKRQRELKGDAGIRVRQKTSEGLIYLTGLPWGTASMMNVWVDYATN